MIAFSFVLAGGVHALQVLGEDMPVTERLTGLDSVNALEVGVDVSRNAILFSSFTVQFTHIPRAI